MLPLYLVVAAVSNAGLTNVVCNNPGSIFRRVGPAGVGTSASLRQQLFIGRNAILGRSLFRLSERNFLKRRSKCSLPSTCKTAVESFGM